MSIRHHRIMTVLLSFAMTLSLIAAPAFIPASMNSHVALAATFSDISNHWAKTYIEKAAEYKIVNGYSDGTFRPDRSVTRAEFTKMINTALGNTSTVVPEFLDVDSSQWFYIDVEKGVAARFINGYDDYCFHPDDTITRQEAAVILSRVIPAAGSEVSINSYYDAEDVAAWANVAMRKIVGKKYMTGADNCLTPAAPLTRGQAAKIIVQIKATEKIISNNQTIVKDGVTIEDAIYSNQLSVGSQVGSGTAILRNCVVLGNVNVQGGGGEGDKGLVLKNCRVIKLTVNRDEENVQVFTQGETTVLNTYIDESASLIEVTQNESGEFGKGFINVYLNKKSEMSLSGKLEILNMTGYKCDATIESGSEVKTMTIQDVANRCDVTLQKNVTMDRIDVYGDMASFYGKGRVTQLNVNAESMTYTTEPVEMNIAETVKVKPTRIIDPSLELTVTATPENGAASVDVDSDIVFHFSSYVRLSGSSNPILTNAEASELFCLKTGSVSGAEVPCDVTVGDQGTTVTLNPKGSLAHDTDYVVQVNKDNLIDEYDNTNETIKYSIHTNGSKSTKNASLSSLEAGLFNGSAIEYTSLSVSPNADNTYYIGNDAESLSIKVTTSTPDPLIRMTMGGITKTAGENGTVSFSIAAGSIDPGIITITAGSYNGDYSEQIYTINVKRSVPESSE